MPEQPTTIDPALARRRAVEGAKAWLVELGEALGGLAARNDDWRGQGRVLWEASRSETEPSVLLNLLKYQAARNKNWRGPNDLLSPTVAALERAIQDAGGDKSLAIELIQLFLVYALRAHRYQEHLRHTENPRPAAGARA